MKNLYYSPEAFGYRVVKTIDLEDEPWQFDMLVVWQRLSDGTYWYATDSGCSCPAPFEDVTVESLNRFDYDEVESLVRRRVDESYRPYRPALDAVRELKEIG